MVLLVDTNKEEATKGERARFVGHFLLQI